MVWTSGTVGTNCEQMGEIRCVVKPLNAEITKPPSHTSPVCRHNEVFWVNDENPYDVFPGLTVFFSLLSSKVKKLRICCHCLTRSLCYLKTNRHLIHETGVFYAPFGSKLASCLFLSFLLGFACLMFLVE